MRTTLCFNCAVTFRPCQMYYCYCTSRQLQWQEHDLGYLVVWKKFIRYNCSKLMCTCTYISTGDILARLPVNPHLAPRGSLQNHTCTLTPQPTWPAKHTWQITETKQRKQRQCTYREQTLIEICCCLRAMSKPATQNVSICKENGCLFICRPCPYPWGYKDHRSRL